MVMFVLSLERGIGIKQAKEKGDGKRGNFRRDYEAE